MGFYLRKSVKVGPFRFNLSTSGVGFSAGIPGLRFGVGPRGNYVHMGRGGVYYRTTLSPRRRGGAEPPHPAALADATPPVEIESAHARTMRDSSSEALLDEIAAKRRTVRVAPLVLGAGLAAALFIVVATPEAPWPQLVDELVGQILAWVPVPALEAFYKLDVRYLPWSTSVAPWLAAGVLAATALGGAIARRRDVLRKTVVLLYELDPDSEARYQALHDGFDQLAGCERVWNVEAKQDVEDWKRSGGANQAVGIKRVTPSKGSPPWVKSNIAIPTLPVGRQTLYFLPDRVLVYEPQGVGAVSYRDLTTERRSTNFIETGMLPTDATVVRTTWQYVNKKGGPDRRFKNNREIPVALYEQLHLRSASGLNEMIQLSKSNAGAAFAEALGKMGGNDMGLFSKPRRAPIAAQQEAEATRDGGTSEERERSRAVLSRLTFQLTSLMAANVRLENALKGLGVEINEDSIRELFAAANGITDAIQPISDHVFASLEALGPAPAE